MADQLRITTPITSREGIDRLQPQRAPTQPDPVDPSRVSSRNENPQNELKENLDFSWTSQSVFQQFVDKLRQTPALSQTLQKLLQGALEQGGTGAEASPVQQLLEKLLQGPNQTKAEILKNLMAQMQTSTRFSPELFDVVRALVRESRDTAFDESAARFLKAYDSFVSREETGAMLIKQLSDIAAYMPKSFRTKLEALMNQLLPMGDLKGEASLDGKAPLQGGVLTDASQKGGVQGSATAGLQANEEFMSFTPRGADLLNFNGEAQGGLGDACDANVKLMKEEIVPLLGKYVSTYNDFGKVREKITLFVYDLARLNQSSKDDVMQTFEELMDRCAYQMNLPGDKMRTMRILFAKMLEHGEAPSNEMADTLAKLLSPETRRELPTVSQTMLKDTLNALLNDQSVFMPYQHFVLPIRHQGAFAFSEIWVEKDDGKPAGKDGEEKPRRLFFSFDVRDLGNFSAAITLTGKKVDLALQYPPSLPVKETAMRDAIARILASTGLEVGEVNPNADAAQLIGGFLDRLEQKRGAVNVTV